VFTFSVIPTTVFVAPAAVLAAVFPAAFAGLARGFRRWRAFLAVTSMTGTLAAGYAFGRPHLRDAWWTGPPAFAAVTLAITAVGLCWAGRRYRLAAAVDPTVTHPPTRRSVLITFGFAALAVLVVIGLAVVSHRIATGGWAGLRGESLRTLLFDLPTRELTAAAVGLTVAAGYQCYRAVTGRADPHPVRLSLSGETAALGVMTLCGAVTLSHVAPRPQATDTDVTTPATSPIRLVDASVWFESSAVTEAVSGVTLTADRGYFGGVKDAFAGTGAVVCFDRATGKQRWVYSDPHLKTVFCTPVVADGRVFCGEGTHSDTDCRLLCLDADTGRRLWEVRTASHTEGTPAVADGRVYFSAGDDGLYCVTTGGEAVWHHPGREQGLHVDSPVAVVGGKVYAGSGYGTIAAFALDAATGRPEWTRELPLRSFGPPLVVGDRVYYGLGTGTLNFDLTDETKPDGAVVCLDAVTGEPVWTHPLDRSVHTQLSADGRAVYAACRDGFVSALDRSTGTRLWRANLGTPITTGTSTVTYTRFGFAPAVYVVTPPGTAAALDPLSGRPIWSRDIAQFTDRLAEVVSPPTLVAVDADGAERHLFVPVTLTNRVTGRRTAAVVRFVDQAR
jgi:outer membrane protein assembly factor BamB